MCQHFDQRLLSSEMPQAHDLPQFVFPDVFIESLFRSKSNLEIQLLQKWLTVVSVHFLIWF